MPEKLARKLEIDALDRQSATLEIARKLSAAYPEISYQETNILDWRPAARLRHRFLHARAPPFQ